MKTLYVSQWLFDQLQKQQEATNRVRGLPSSSLTDLPLQVSQFLPIEQRTGNIVQKDPFVTYEKSDMDWAEPLGLAAWETAPSHCLEVDVPDVPLYEGLFSIPHPTPRTPRVYTDPSPKLFDFPFRAIFSV